MLGDFAFDGITVAVEVWESVMEHRQGFGQADDLSTPISSHLYRSLYGGP